MYSIVHNDHGQEMREGSQVVYLDKGGVDAVNDGPRSSDGALLIHVLMPKLKVAKVVSFREWTGDEESPGWIDVTLDDGHTLDCNEVIVTDGKYSPLPEPDYSPSPRHNPLAG